MEIQLLQIVFFSWKFLKIFTHSRKLLIVKDVGKTNKKNNDQEQKSNKGSKFELLGFLFVHHNWNCILK